MWAGAALPFAVSLPGPPRGRAEHLSFALVSSGSTNMSRTASLGAQHSRGSLHKDPVPLPLHPRFHRDSLGTRVMPLPCSLITRTCQPQEHGQQGVTCGFCWFDALAFLGAARHPSPLWLCTGPVGCVVSNDLSPRSSTLLGAGVWLATLKCCMWQSLASQPRHLSSCL